MKQSDEVMDQSGEVTNKKSGYFRVEVQKEYNAEIA